MIKMCRIERRFSRNSAMLNLHVSQDINKLHTTFNKIDVFSNEVWWSVFDQTLSQPQEVFRRWLPYLSLT